jgi:hypothetical protein
MPFVLAISGSPILTIDFDRVNSGFVGFFEFLLQPIAIKESEMNKEIVIL